jgi:hypothetical protein
MRSLCKTAGSLVAGFLLVQLVQAQAPTTPVYGMAGLVTQPGVQKELKLTDKQVDQVKKAAQAVTEKHKDELAQAKMLQGAEKFKKESELSKLIAEESNTALATVLSADQVTRLKQIRMQQRGIYAFGEADVSTALKLTPEQSKKIRAVDKEYQLALIEIGKLATAEEKANAANTAIKDALTKALDILDENQKKTWNALTGPPYRGK